MKSTKRDLSVSLGIVLLLLLFQLGPANPLKCETSVAIAWENKSDEGSNKAVTVKLVHASLEEELAGQKAQTGKVFFVLNTLWENIHLKQKVEKNKLDS
jgi:hypothetical protein